MLAPRLFWRRADHNRYLAFHLPSLDGPGHPGHSPSEELLVALGHLPGHHAGPLWAEGLDQLAQQALEPAWRLVEDHRVAQLRQFGQPAAASSLLGREEALEGECVCGEPRGG